MNRSAVRVVLVDDHAVVRAGFRRMLEQNCRIQVVAEADSGDEAYALSMEYEPDVIVMDLSMPGVSGLETIRRISSRQLSARILVFSMHEDASLAERAIQMGARGYVTKSSAPDTLVTAVTEIADGKVYLSDDIAKSIALLKLTGNVHPITALSTREFEIFRLFVRGRQPVDIAQALNLSAKTIANYHTLIKHKLGMASDVELVLLAARHNLL